MRILLMSSLLSFTAAGGLSVAARADDWTSPRDVSRSAREFADATQQLHKAIKDVDEDSPLVAEVFSLSNAATRLQDAVDKGARYEAAKQDFHKIESGYAQFEANLKKAHDVHHEKPVAELAKKVKAAFDGLQAHMSGRRPAEKHADDGSVTTVPVPGGGRPVVARADAEGAIHLFYDSGDGPKYARSSDGGTTFSPAISVVGEGQQRAGLEYSAWDMAVGKGGRVHVAMGTNAWKLKLPQEEWGFFYASLDPGQAAFSPVRNINRKPSEGFSLAADDRGNVTACWLSDRLYANISHDNGETFTPFVEIDSSVNPCNCCTTSAAYGADGRLAVLYREETGNERDMYLVLWDQDRGRVSRTRVSRTLWKIDACPMTYYTVSRDRGGFVAVWPTRGQVYLAHLDARGDLSPPGEIQTPGRSGMRTGIIALSAPDGKTLVAWNNNDQVGWQLYGAGGQPLGQPGSARGAGKGVAGVVGKDGRFVLFR
jgi:hypothetical protein